MTDSVRGAAVVPTGGVFLCGSLGHTGSGAGDGNGSPLAGPAELTQDAAAQLSHKDQLAAYHKTMGTQPTEEGADPFAALAQDRVHLEALLCRV